jgi:hypothetical protein
MYSSHSEKQKQSVTIFNGNFKNYNNYLTQLSEDTCFWHELKKQFDAKGTDVVEELVLPIFIIDHLASFLTKTTSRFCGEKKITNNSDLIAFITMQLINDIVDNNSEEDTLWLLNKLFNL